MKKFEVFRFTKEVGAVSKISTKALNFSSSMTAGFSRRIQLHGVSFIYLKHVLSSCMSNTNLHMTVSSDIQQHI
jgi:hypothetical protein